MARSASASGIFRHHGSLHVIVIQKHEWASLIKGFVRFGASLYSAAERKSPGEFIDVIRERPLTPSLGRVRNRAMMACAAVERSW